MMQTEINFCRQIESEAAFPDLFYFIVCLWRTEFIQSNTEGWRPLNIRGVLGEPSFEVRALLPAQSQASWEMANSLELIQKPTKPTFSTWIECQNNSHFQHVSKSYCLLSPHKCSVMDHYLILAIWVTMAGWQTLFFSLSWWIGHSSGFHLWTAFPVNLQATFKETLTRNEERPTCLQ